MQYRLKKPWFIIILLHLRSDVGDNSKEQSLGNLYQGLWIFPFSQSFQPSMYISAFELTVCDFTIQFDLFGTIKVASECCKTNFG